MELLDAAAAKELAEASFILCDLDDTLTLDGALPQASYAALENLVRKGRQVIIVTGRPAGWCDMIARLWPVAAVVGENGAFYFRYDQHSRGMTREFQRSAEQRRADQSRLSEIFQQIQRKYPGVRLAADQAFRISDYAVDFCEDVSPLPQSVVSDIVHLFEAHGATAKVSSIHVNAWIGDFSKLQMSLSVLESLGLAEREFRRRVAYVGDSPNDEPMFEYFPLSVGVANIRSFLSSMKSHPRWITTQPGGLGFAELEGWIE
jgi:HAD superfamily hydrolase (TIGR01484 family)